MTLIANDEARITDGMITEFLAAIFADTKEEIFFQTLANDSGDADEAPNKKSILTRELLPIARFVGRHDRNRRGLFFCVATIAKGSSTRNKDNCCEITVAHTDLDFRSIAEDEPAVRRVLDTLPIPPSIIVFSGGGLHLYWLLKEPLPAQQYRDRIEALNRQLASVLAGDPAATDVCRLMRLPGTTNSKYGSQRKAAVEKLDADLRYDFDELEEKAGELAQKLFPKEADPAKVGIRGSKKPAQTQPDNPFLQVAEEQGWKPPLDVEQALASMTYPGNVHDVQIRVAASLAKAGVERADAVLTILNATQAGVGLHGDKWDWKAEEKAIGAAYDSAVAKFDIRPGNAPGNAPGNVVSRETPQTPDSVAVKGAGIGAENVVQFAQKDRAKPRKSAQKAELQAAFLVADGLIETLRQDGQDIMLAEGGIWIYQDGFWRTMSPADEQRLRTVVQQGFEDLGEAAKGNTLTLAWKRLTEHPKLYKAKVPWSAGGLIVCRNGVLAVDVGQFGPHAPENYAIRCIGADFDVTATCPRFEALLFNMLGDQERVALVQEWLGAALAIRHLSREERRALIMVGPSRTGKTELARIFRLLLGSPIATPSVAEVSDDRDKFALSSLYGAVAWIRDDAINEGDKLNPQRFKTIVTGEPTDVGLKHRDTVRDYCFEIPVCLTCNGLPKAIDASDAIYNRSLILKMTNVIDEEAAAMVRREEGVPRGQSIGTAIFEEEGAGILNWALAGLARLRARGYFEIPASVRDAIAQFKDDNNPVVTWASEAMEADPWSKVARHDLVRSYNGWQLEQEGDRAVGRGGAWLLPKIRNLIKGLGDMKTHSGKRFITGVKLTAVGLATWESYGKASPRNGPGGLALTVQEVNQAHDADENPRQVVEDIPF